MDSITQPTPENNQNTQSSQPKLPVKDYSEKSVSESKITTYVLVAAMFIASLVGVYTYQQNKINALNSEISQIKNKAESKAKTSSNYTEGYRGGASGVKLKQPVDTIATQTLDILKIYYKNNNEYPASETTPMLQLWQENGYNGMSAAGSLKCPDFNGYFSYTGFQDPESGKIQTIKLYYCDGEKVVSKTQTDI